MARFPLACLVLSVFALVGCQSTQMPTAALPGPNFAGPTVIQPAYVAPAPAVVMAPRPQVIRPATPAPAMRGIPAAWIPLATAQHREWKWIVIHHSATPTGGAAAFDKAHKAKGWDGLGYDFVIGNGTDTGDGQIEVGYRWPIQTQGAHAYTPNEQFNMHGIGICLVGNMDNHPPTARQMQSLVKLVAYLVDTYHIKQSDIIGHKMTGKQTDCPGSMTNIDQIRAAVARLRHTVIAEDPAPVPGEELMKTASR